MFVEILAILAIPTIASTAFLLGQKSVESRENAAYRAGLQDGYEEGRKEEKIVRMAR